MPIYGLTTNVPKTFLRLAKIKKGEKVKQKNAEGKEVEVMKDMDHFRVVFEQGCDDVATAFKAHYGDAPTRINMRLAFREISECWDANFVAYDKGGQLARASSNEERLYWVWYRDKDTGEMLVRDGRPLNAKGAELMSRPILLNEPICTYKNSKGEITPIFLEHEGRLNIVVPEVAMVNDRPRVGFFEFCPKTPADIRRISQELLGIESLAKDTGKDITGIPMVLTRREELAPQNINGKRSRVNKWIVHIEVGGEWGGKALEAIKYNALPDNIVDGEILEPDEPDEQRTPIVVNTTPVNPITGQPYASAPAQDDDSYQPPDFGGPVTPMSTPASAPKPAEPKVEKPKSVAKPRAETADTVRPYPPLVFKAKFEEIVEAMPAIYQQKGMKLTATAQEGHVLAKILDGVFDGDKPRRYLLCAWLTGINSTKEMPPAVIKTFFKVMGIRDDAEHSPQFEDAPSDVALKELRDAFDQAMLETNSNYKEKK